MVKGVLGFRFGLCFLRLHLILAGSPFSATESVFRSRIIHRRRHSSSLPKHSPSRREKEGNERGERVSRVRTNRVEPRPTATSCFCHRFCIHPGSTAGKRTRLFRGQFIIFPSERRRKLASLPFCRPTARFRPRIAPLTLSLVFISVDISSHGKRCTPIIDRLPE